MEKARFEREVEKKTLRTKAIIKGRKKIAKKDGRKATEDGP